MNSKKRLNIFDYLKKKNVKRFSLFFAIAFVFLIFSKLSNDYKQIIKLKVNLVNLEDEIILQNDSTNVINAYVEAKGFALLPLIFKSSTTINLDVNQVTTTNSNLFVFDVQKHKFLIEEQLSKSYKIRSLLPDTLRLQFSKSASKYVPVKLKHAVSYAVGFDIKGDFDTNIDSVKVVGPSEEVDKVTMLLTQNLSLNSVNSNINETLILDISNYKNIEIFPNKVEVTGEVSRFTEGSIEVPLVITNLPTNVVLNYFPKTVTIVYYVDLDNYNAIKASDFEVICNYLEVTDNQTYFVPKINKMPKSVKRISIKQNRIDFIKL